MKTRNILLALLTLVTLLVSCKSTYNPKYSKDALANIDPFKMGEAVVNVNKFLAYDLGQINMTMSLEPRMNRVIVEYPFQVSKVSLYLDAADRAAILDAVARYGTAFEAKTLEAHANKTAAFGVIKSDMKWGMDLGNKGEAVPDVKVGYRFIDGSPYFMLTVPETANDLYGKSTGGSRIKTSPFIVMCFNRAQATVFAEFLTDERIKKEIASQNVPANLEINPEKDINAPDSY